MAVEQGARIAPRHACGVDTTRDPCDVSAFQLADSLVLEVYRAVEQFPESERFGRQVQLYCAAVSVRSAIADAYTRHSEGDFLHGLATAICGAIEVQDLLRQTVEVGFLDAVAGERIAKRYDYVARALQHTGSVSRSGRAAM